MKYTSFKLKDVASTELSGVDKKTVAGERPVRLCNYTDVYSNWAITSSINDTFMEATVKEKELSRFLLRKGQVAITKDSETRDDIGIPAYIADDFNNVVLGYHNALITPDEGLLDGKYLNALLHSDYAKKYFAFNASGSGQRYALFVDTFDNFPLNLPSLREQKRIGEIFSLIDRKITLSRSLNHNLASPARSSAGAEARLAA